MAEIPIDVCHNAPVEVRLLDRKKDRIKVRVRLVGAFTGRPGPVVLTGTLDLGPKPAGFRFRARTVPRYCAFLGRARRWNWAVGGPTVTRRPLPLYARPDPGLEPSGVLAGGAVVAIDRAGLDQCGQVQCGQVKRGQARFLKVWAQSATLYVPFNPGLFQARVGTPGRPSGCSPVRFQGRDRGRRVSL